MRLHQIQHNHGRLVGLAMIFLLTVQSQRVVAFAPVASTHLSAKRCGATPPSTQYTTARLLTNRITRLGAVKDKIKGAATSPRNNRVTRTKETSAIKSKNDETDFTIPPHILKPLALLLLAQFILFIGVGAVIPSIPLYGKEIGLSSSANGVVISVPSVALLLAAQWSGTFADKARKPAMMGGMLLIAASDFGTAMATGMVPLVAARLGLGLGRSISESGERGLLADLANRIPQVRGRLLAAQQASTAIGIAIGAPIGGIVAEQYGPRAAFLCVTAAALVALSIFSFLPETTEWAPIEDDQALEASHSSRMAPLDKDQPIESDGKWIELLAIPEWRGLALCQCGATFGFASKIASIPLLASAILPGGAAGAGALISATGLSGLAGAPIGGWLTDRTGAKTTVILSGIVSSISLMLIPVALSILSTTDGSEEATFLVLGGVSVGAKAAAFSALVICWGMGAAAQGPAMTAVAQQLAPTGAEATSMALPRAAGDGTYIVAPFLLGLAADSFLNVQGVDCAVAGTATLLGVVSLLLVDTANSTDGRN